MEWGDCLDSFDVLLGEPYSIYFRRSFEGLPEVFDGAGLMGRKVFVVTDSNVGPLYLAAVEAALDCVGSFVFAAGEASKNIDTIQGIYSAFLAHRLDRRSVVVALGGGVVGDMAGFAAATFMRGLPFVQLPTSLLAQVDAGVGGKTGFDFDGLKNLVGAFYQPRLVYMNLDSLDTLPSLEFTSGLAEVIKHGFIGDSDYYRYLLDHREAILDRVPEAMLEVIRGSCRIKAAVVAKDERESGLREILNFGHCVGHAIESLSGYSLPHGHCVAIGMCAALHMSGIEEGKSLIESFGLPTKVEGMASSDILATMFLDKKTQNDTLRIVLLKKFGEAYTDDGLTHRQMLEALDSVVL